MNRSVSLSAEEQSVTLRILKNFLPTGYRAFVFGSRASGVEVKPWADLDLSIEGPKPLPIVTLAALAEAFDESPLSWKVDLVDRLTVSDEFAAIIDRGKVPFFEG